MAWRCMLYRCLYVHEVYNSYECNAPIKINTACELYFALERRVQTDDGSSRERKSKLPRHSATAIMDHGRYANSVLSSF